MAANLFQHKSDSELRLTAQNAASVLLESPEQYGLTPAQAELLQEKADGFGEAIARQNMLRAQAQAATCEKNHAREELIALLSRYGSLMYLSDVSADLLARAGFAIHDERRTRPVLHQPLRFLA
ncbi:MAG TPA: hypothetical protein VEX38_08605, partial [Fimbriimonadaceae bacterium]|nr:hypothetical protein [Fimbriimonadaceae bacterium]